MARRRNPLPIGAFRIHVDRVDPPILPPLSALASPPVLPSSQPHPSFPFTNLAFEGGGAKGIAYCGALGVLEEHGVWPQHVRRIAGTSSGSLFATLLALGYTSGELLELLYAVDVAELMQDARFGRVGQLVNIVRTFGFNPGTRLIEFLGERLEERTGSKDVTFSQLYARCGRELCVPITNITRMTTEYCHPKTTPDMPVRLAVGMSMSLPVLMQPYRLVRDLGEGDARWQEEDLYTDGGLLCNYPLHVFDGWWLSTAPADTFLARLRPASEISRLIDPTVCFHPASSATLGFTVFDNAERDLTASWVPEGGGPPGRPDTTLAQRAGDDEARSHRLSARTRALEAAFTRLMDALGRVEQNGDGRISRAELQQLFGVGGLDQHDADVLFGTTDLDAIFSQLDDNDDGTIDYGELLRFMDAQNVDLTARVAKGRRSESGSVTDFLSNVMNTMLVHIRQSSLRHADRFRTVPIDTDYVGTADFMLEPADRAFLVETGARAMRAYLRGWQERQ